MTVPAGLVEHLKFIYTDRMTQKTASFAPEFDKKDPAIYCPGNQDEDDENSNDLGLLFCLGIGCDQDISKGYQLLSRAAASGSQEARYNIGVLDYFKLRPDSPPIPGIFQSSAASGIMEANYFLGQHQEKSVRMVAGHDLAADRADAVGEAKVRAVPYYKKSASVNHVPSLIRLAELYRDEVDIQDTARAAEYALKAANLGSIDGMLIAGELFLNGFSPRIIDPLRQDAHWGTTEFSPFKHWFEGSKNNIRDLEAAIVKYNTNIPAALNLFHAAKTAGSAKACRRLAEIYLQQYKDIRSALEFYDAGVRLQDYQCAYDMAVLLETNQDFRNIPQAIHFYKVCIHLTGQVTPAFLIAPRIARAQATRALARLEAEQQEPD